MRFLLITVKIYEQHVHTLSVCYSCVSHGLILYVFLTIIFLAL